MIILSEVFLKRNEKLYFVSKDTNIIGYIELNTGKINFVECIPEESAFAGRLCSKIIERDEELIFIPMNARKVWRYNTITKKWHGIKLGKYEYEINKTFQAVVYDDYLFMIGCNCPAIFRLDLVTEQLLFIEEPLKNLKGKKRYPGDALFRSNYVQNGTKLYMASCLDNTVMVFDLRDQNIEFYKVGDEKNRYSGIAWDGNYYWLAPRYKTSVVRWDGDKEIIEYKLPNEKLDGEIGFLGIVIVDNVLVLPGRRKYTVIVDRIPYVSMNVIEKAYVFFDKEKNDLLCLDIDGELCVVNGNKKRIQLSVEERMMREFQLKTSDNNGGCFDENEELELKDYIEIVPYSKGKICGIEEGKVKNNIWNKFIEG